MNWNEYQRREQTIINFLRRMNKVLNETYEKVEDARYDGKTALAEYLLLASKDEVFELETKHLGVVVIKNGKIEKSGWGLYELSAQMPDMVLLNKNKLRSHPTLIDTAEAISHLDDLETNPKIVRVEKDIKLDIYGANIVRLLGEAYIYEPSVKIIGLNEEGGLLTYITIRLTDPKTLSYIVFNVYDEFKEFLGEMEKQLMEKIEEINKWIETVKKLRAEVELMKKLF